MFGSGLHIGPSGGTILTCLDKYFDSSFEFDLLDQVGKGFTTQSIELERIIKNGLTLPPLLIVL